MLYTCKESKYNDAKNEEELIEYAKKVVENKAFKCEIDYPTEEKIINSISDVSTAKEVIEKYAEEIWNPVTDSQEIRDIIHTRLRYMSYEAFEKMLESNGLYPTLDEHIISETELEKFADKYTDEVLEEYIQCTGKNSSVNDFVIKYVRDNGIEMSEKIFSFNQYWDELVNNAINNLISLGLDPNAVKMYCTLSHGKDVQIAAYNVDDAEDISEKIIEN